jgi:hypothetical protein
MPKLRGDGKGPGEATWPTRPNKAIDYSLKRWAALTRFLDDGRLCTSNNAAERELRAIAVGRRNWTFAGSDEGGRRAGAIYTLIATAKVNDCRSTGLARRTCSPTYIYPVAYAARDSGSGARHVCQHAVD